MGSPAQASFPAWRQWLLAGVETEVGGRVRIIGEETGTRERLRESDSARCWLAASYLFLYTIHRSFTFVVSYQFLCISAFKSCAFNSYDYIEQLITNIVTILPFAYKIANLLVTRYRQNKGT